MPSSSFLDPLWEEVDTVQVRRRCTQVSAQSQKMPIAAADVEDLQAGERQKVRFAKN
jgi:hypothetical protein